MTGMSLALMLNTKAVQSVHVSTRPWLLFAEMTALTEKEAAALQRDG